MHKSVYSLVLSDEVVEAVDRMAYAENTSRSALINRILAERVSCVTPEMRMNDIFSCIVQRMTDGCFRIQPHPSEAMLSIRSALKYKYNPTIRYSLELYRGGGKTIGALKVSFRTQSAALIDALTTFFRLWAALEERYVVRFFPEGITYEIADGRFIRSFRLPPDKEQCTTEEIGTAISAYIRTFDSVLKTYFSALPIEQEQGLRAATQAYETWVGRGIVII